MKTFFFCLFFAVLVIFLFPLPIEPIGPIRPIPSTRITMLSIGQGDAILIQSPSRTVLIDGGPDDVVIEQLGLVLPWWNRHIDTLILTHPHADHFMGLIEVMSRFRVDEAFDDGQSYGTPEFTAYLQAAGDKRSLMSAGDILDLGGNATLTALFPSAPYDSSVLSDPNAGSLVLLLEHDGCSMLLTGDLGETQEQEPLDAGLIPDVDALKVGHHGSSTSSSSAFLAAARPEIALISVGTGNSYGHPAPDAVARLHDIGAQVFRTDLQGSLGLTCTNGSYFVSTLR